MILVHGRSEVTAGVRTLADGFAADGYEAFALDLAASGDIARDLQAAVSAIAAPVFLAGYEWGGTAAWIAACRCEGVAAVSSHDGEGIAELIVEAPICPVVVHFGQRDPLMPAGFAEAIRAAHPLVAVHGYDAARGFAFQPSADVARLAHLRTLQLFARSVGGRGEM